MGSLPLFVRRRTSSSEQAFCRVEAFLHLGQLCSCVVEIVTQRIDLRSQLRIAASHLQLFFLHLEFLFLELETDNHGRESPASITCE